MGHGKETPRQKMIGMMYLVLTALLALNVAKSILDAFIVVNDGLVITNKSFSEKNGKLYVDFAAALANNKDKVQPFYDAADKAKELTRKMEEYIHELKKELIIEVDKCEPDIADAACSNLKLVVSRDNYDIPTLIMVPEPATPEVGKARVLKEELNKFRDDMLELIKDEKLNITPSNREKILKDMGNLGINTEDPEPDPNDDDAASRNWEGKTFYHNVIVATITILTKIQNDVKNAESMVVTTLLNQVDANDFKFDMITGKIIPKSSYILQGGAYEADLFVAAYSTTENPIIIVGQGWDPVNRMVTGDTTMIPVVEGVGKYSVPANAVGPQKFSAMIKLKKPGTDGSAESDWNVYSIPDVEYRVAPPSVIVSPLKMNVLYRGIDNPLGVSAAGIPIEDVSASGTNCTLSKVKAGEYNARPGPGNTASVSVTAMVEGKSKSMGKATEFRVKDVPDPVAKVFVPPCTKYPTGKLFLGGTITKKDLITAGGVVAILDNFAFDLSFNVVSFKVSAQSGGYFDEVPGGGSKFNDKHKKMINALEVKQRITIEDIYAQGPDGKKRPLNGITFKIIP